MIIKLYIIINNTHHSFAQEVKQKQLLGFRANIKENTAGKRGKNFLFVLLHC